MSFYLLNDVCELEPGNLPVKGLTFDIENVLTDYGNPDVRPEVIDLLGQIVRQDIGIVLATNNTESDFIHSVKEQIDEPLGISIETFSKIDTGSKLKPEMFHRAANRLHLKSKDMGHVDDQFKSHIGAIRAGYSINIWPLPYGENEHPGVARFRSIEMTAIRGTIQTLHSTKAFVAPIQT